MDDLDGDLVRGHLNVREQRDEQRQQGEGPDLERELHAQRKPHPPQRAQVGATPGPQAEVPALLRNNQKTYLHAVGDHGGEGGARHPSVQNEHEEVGQGDVDQVGHHRSPHRGPRLTLTVSNLAQGHVKQGQGRAQDPYPQISARGFPGSLGGCEVPQELRRDLATDDRGDSQGGRGHHRGAQHRPRLLRAVGAHRLGHQSIGRAQESYRKAEEAEGGYSGQAHPGQLGAPQAAHQQGVDQRHHAVRDHRHRDGPRDPCQLSERFICPRKLHAGTRRKKERPRAKKNRGPFRRPRLVSPCLGRLLAQPDPPGGDHRGLRPDAGTDRPRADGAAHG
jgi:hypothetical protein